MAPTRKLPLLLLTFLLCCSGALAQRWKLGEDLVVRKLAGGVWMHTSTLLIGEDLVPANGLLVETGDALLLIDTPFTDEQTENLIGWARKRLKRKVARAIVTHYHNDRIGGIRALMKHGIEASSTPLTYAMVDTAKYPRPTPSLGNDTTLRIGRRTVQVFHPGGGHTRDNIVVWLPSQRILFGGCLVKSEYAETLGNIADADLGSWPHAISNLLERYGKARLVIPGHGPVGGVRLLTHTRDLVNGYNAEHGEGR